MMCNFDLNKSYMNIIAFTTHLLYLHCTFSELFTFRDKRGVVNKPVRLSLIQVDMQKAFGLGFGLVCLLL